MALDACDLPVKAYWLCRQDAAFAVIVKCRQENEDMKACVSAQTGNKPVFDAYRQKRVDEIAPALLKQREQFLTGKLNALTAAAATGGAVNTNLER